MKLHGFHKLKDIKLNCFLTQALIIYLIIYTHIHNRIEIVFTQVTMSSALYVPYKAVGVVTDGLPFFVNRLGEENFIYTSIGESFQVFRFDRLTVCLASKAIPNPPSASAADGSSNKSKGVSRGPSRDDNR